MKGKERKIQTANPDEFLLGYDDRVHPDDLEIKMAKSDFVTQEDIRKYANYIISAFEKEFGKEKNKKKEVIFIIDALQTDTILEYFSPNGDLEGLTSEEIEETINTIRQALILELRTRLELDSEDFMFLKREIQKGVEESEGKKIDTNYVWELVSPKGEASIFKENIFSRRETGAALKKLIAALEEVKLETGHPYPYIVDIKHFDPEDAASIVEKLDIETLQDKIKNFYEESSDCSVYEILDALVDAMEAAEFLKNNGLVLEDIKLANIGAKRGDGISRGILFDLDRVVNLGEEHVSRLVTADYEPPETLDNNEKEIPVTAKEMVYQFGVCLQKILIKLSSEIKADVRYKIQDIAKEMTEKNPRDRIFLEESIDLLSDALGVEEEEKEVA